MSQTPGIAVVGAGNWGRNLIRVHDELGSLRMVCDSDPAALARARAQCPTATAAPDFEDVLRNPDVRGVVLALPPALHFAFAERAMAAGKDVCVEKPIALDVAHARVLEDMARDSGRVLMVGHLLRFHPAFVALKERVDSGAYGRILRIDATRRDTGHFDGASALWDLAPHDLSMILCLTGRPPERVAITGSGRVDGGPAEVELEFSSGVFARARVSRTHPCRERFFEVTLEKGRLAFDDTLPWERKLAVHPVPGTSDSAPRPDVEYVPLTPTEPLRAECRHFLECMADRTSPITDGAEGRRVLEVLGASGEANEALLCTLGRPSGPLRGPLFV